ncbi:HAD domain-containing protein [Mucilaginibacter sp. Mucisp84]|jgi:hypothetical protein|uniref:HAD domain-containing protein n=1 Tax=unclassified Mucilaginibacter TaxID=2617802 RepID=UPI00359CDB4D
MLILLDIDGVLVPANSWKKPEFMPDGFPVFNSRAVKALQHIIAETNASVILTTSHKSKYKVAEWKDLLKTRGISPKKVHRLTTNSLKKTRTEEILEWYKKKHQPSQEFVIIDDDKMLNGLPENIKHNLVLTSPSVGLTEDLAEDAISILRNRNFTFS